VQTPGSGPPHSVLPVYRYDIDGLRAVAVLSVVFAHAGAPWASGGFLGVDVFFVISGFLITRILLSEGALTGPGLRTFYLRRIRRIVPALALMMACTVPSIFLRLPDGRENFGQSLAASALFANNLLLAATSGYWALASAFKPLLHTWSLGVEEQFYVAFPLALMLATRVPSVRPVALIAVVGVLSFACAEYGWRHFPDVSFYLPITRAWELMVGCGAACVRRQPGRADGALALLSLAAIAAPMALYDSATPSPSAYSLVPVAGAAGILLFSRPGSAAAKVLSWRPLAAIGLASYSIYLWHQPLFAIARIVSWTPPSAAEMAALTAMSLLVGGVSWRFVEQPFRDRSRISDRALLLFAGASMGALTAIGLIIALNSGFPRWTYPGISDSRAVNIAYNERIRAFQKGAFAPGRGPKLLVVGDSFGRDVANVLIETGITANAELVYAPEYPTCEGRLAVRPQDRPLYARAHLIVVALDGHSVACVLAMRSAIRQHSRARVLFFGEKNFGYNINPFALVPSSERSSARAVVPPAIVDINEALRRTLAPGEYVDQLRLLSADGRHVAFFDENGTPLAPDRWHLTRYGARLEAARLPIRAPAAWAAMRQALRVPEAR
jgi:peptidoglycan/LPS O-acetylase OafA/YrhL